MKKSLFAALAFGAFACAAHAQSSVTLYGIVDEGLLFNNNAKGGHLYSLSSGELQGSRWGVRGAEDLGGGLQAMFVLENGFNLSNGALGQGGLEFGRQAYVGLKSTFGTVTMGRQYDSVVDYVGPLEAADQWGGFLAAHAGDVDNFNNTNRVNNAIKYTSANYNGLTFGGLYSFGGTAGQFAKNQVWSLGAGYSNGPLTLGIGYLNARTPANFGGMFNTGVTAATTAVTTPIYGTYANHANTYQVIGAAGAYTFGAATIGATYSNTKFIGYSVGPFVNETSTFNNGEINFKYQLTPALLIGAAYDYTQGSKIEGSSAAKYHQGSLGVDYFLSKRTDVYVVGVYQHASGTNLDTEGNIVEAVAAINSLDPSTTENQVAFRVGIRHKF